MSGWPFARLSRPRQQGQAPLSAPTTSVQGHPRLHVSRIEPGLWWAQVTRPDGTGPGRAAPTHGQALAVGLAALEHATVAGSRP